MGGRGGRKRLVGLRNKIGTDVQFRWVQSVRGQQSPSKTKWASCAVRKSTQKPFKRNPKDVAITIGDPGSPYISSDAAALAVTVFATFAFFPFSVPGRIIGYAGSVAEGGTYAITGTGLGGRIGLSLTSLMGLEYAVNRSITRPTFTEFTKPCSENEGDFG